MGPLASTSFCWRRLGRPDRTHVGRSRSTSLGPSVDVRRCSSTSMATDRTASLRDRGSAITARPPPLGSCPVCRGSADLGPPCTRLAMARIHAPMRLRMRRLRGQIGDLRARGRAWKTSYSSGRRKSLGCDWRESRWSSSNWCATSRATRTSTCGALCAGDPWRSCSTTCRIAPTFGTSVSSAWRRCTAIRAVRIVCLGTSTSTACASPATCPSRWDSKCSTRRGVSTTDSTVGL